MIEAPSTHAEAIHKHRLKLIVAQVSDVETEKSKGRSRNIILITPSHNVERSRHQVDHRSAEDSPLSMNRRRLEIVQIVSRHRIAKPSRGKQRSIVRVKGKD